MKKLIQKYFKNSYKSIKCKGYTKYNKNNDYSQSKTPITKNFTKKEYESFSESECIEWINQKGWIGWLLPGELIAIDVEDNNKIRQIFELLEKQGIKNNTGIHKTKNGYHFIFKNSKNVKGGSKTTTNLGFDVTYRLGGKNYLILEPAPDRYWKNFVDNKDLTELPTELEPKEKKKHTIQNINTEPISFQIAKDLSQYFYQENGYIRGNENLAKTFGHKPTTDHKGYVKPANKLDTECLVIGGTTYTLKEMCDTLNIEYKEYYKSNTDTYDTNDGNDGNDGYDYTKLKYGKLLKILTKKLNWICNIDGENLFVWKKHENGYYINLSKEQQNYEISNIFPELTPSRIGNLRVGITRQKQRHINDKYIFFESMKHGIPFLNGVYDLEKDEFRKYKDGDYFTNPINLDIDENNFTTENIEWFRERVKEWTVKKDEWSNDDKKENVNYFINLMSYLLFIYPNDANIWVNFYGEGQNGKSVFLEFCERILGNDNTVGIDLSTMNRFSTSTFENKRLIIGRDSGNYIKEDGVRIIKNLTGDNRILIEKKGLQPYDTYITCKLIVSTNYHIRTRENSPAWYRRIIPIHFQNTFKRDGSIKKEMEKRKHDITFYLCKIASFLKRQDDEFLFERMPEDYKELLQETKKDNNPVLSFYNDVVKDDKNRFNGMVVKEFYNIYKEWFIEQFGEKKRIFPALNKFTRKDGLLYKTEFPNDFEIIRERKGNSMFIK